MQNRFFVKNILFLLFLNLLIKPFWVLGIDREVQNLIGGGGDLGYGIYNSVFSLTFLFYILLDLGITSYNSRNIAQNSHLLSKYFFGITQIKLFLSLLYGVVIFVAGLIIGFRGSSLTILAWCGLNQMLLSLILFMRSNIQGLLLFKVDGFLSVFDRLLAIAICSVLLWSGLFPRENFTILWYLKAQTVAYILTLALALYVVLRHTHQLSFKVNIPLFIAILKQSMPYALLVLLMSFYSRLEPVLLVKLLPDDGDIQSGIYAQAYRLFDAGNNISYLFGVILLPLFASMIKKGENIDSLVKVSFNIIVALIGMASILCIIYSDEIMRLLYTKLPSETTEGYDLRCQQVANTFQFLMVSFFAYSTTYVFGALLTANGSLKQLNIIAASGVILNVILNLILIPHFKAEGAACTSLCVQVFTAVIQFIVAKRIMKIDMDVKYWLQVVTFLILTTATSIIIKRFDLNWKLGFATSLTINVGLVFATRLVGISDVLALFKAREKNE